MLNSSSWTQLDNVFGIEPEARRLYLNVKDNDRMQLKMFANSSIPPYGLMHNLGSHQKCEKYNTDLRPSLTNDVS